MRRMKKLNVFLLAILMTIGMLLTNPLDVLAAQRMDAFNQAENECKMIAEEYQL